MTYVTRLMRDEDIPQAIEIDREAFPTQWPHPSYASFKRELSNQLVHYIVVCKQLDEAKTIRQDTTRNLWQLFWSNLFTATPRQSLTSQDYIVGYAGFWKMVDEAHLTTIAVRDTYRRRGLGELLLISVIHLAMQLKAGIITLEVRRSNRVAQALYEKYGFKVVGLRRGYYSDNGEDAILMSTDTITSASFQNQFYQLRQAHAQKWGKTFNYDFSEGV